MSLDFLSGRARSVFIADQEDNPVFTELLRTSGYVAKTTNTSVDETLNFERSMQETYVTGFDVAAPDIASNLRLDTQTYKNLVYGIQADYDNPLRDINITGTLDFTVAANKVGGADMSAIKAEDWFKLTIGSQSWVVRASADGAADGVVIHPDIIKADVASASGTAKSKVWMSGNHRHQYYLQSRVKGDDGSGGDKTFYRNFFGFEIFSFTLDCATESFATLGMNMTGLGVMATGDDRLEADGTITGQTDAAKEDKGIISTGMNLGMVYLDSQPKECEFASFNFTFDNTGEALGALWCEGAAAIGYSNPVGSGTLSAYVPRTDPFKFETMRDDRTVFDFSIMMHDDTDTLVFNLPKCRFTSANQDEGGTAAVSNNDLGVHGSVYIYKM